MANDRNWEEVSGNSGIWIPKTKGDVLEGEVVEINMAQYGIQVSVKTNAGEIYSTPSHKVLQVRLKAVKIDDYIKIVFQGTDLPKIKGHNPMQLYTVYIDKPKEETV